MIFRGVNFLAVHFALSIERARPKRADFYYVAEAGQIKVFQLVVAREAPIQSHANADVAHYKLRPSGRQWANGR